MCDKYFDNRMQLRSHNKIHESFSWSTPPSKLNSTKDIPTLSEIRVAIVNESSLNDIVVEDSDSAVSERVLLDTVAERKVMDRIGVSRSS